MNANTVRVVSGLALALFGVPAVSPAGGPTLAVPAAAANGAPGPRASNRMLYEVPDAPGLWTSRDDTPAAGPPPTTTATVSPATVARELGTAAPEERQREAPVPTDATVAADRDGTSDIRRRYRLRGLVAVGVGSHGSYQAGIGVSTQVRPDTTLSAGVSVGRWADGWGWWYPAPWSDRDGGPATAP